MNVELAEKVLRQITEHPETHDQKHWGARDATCGTTYCIAGWACVLSGDEPNWFKPFPDVTLRMDSVTVQTGRTPHNEETLYRAMDLLGLSPAQAEDLFYELDKAEVIVCLRELIEEAKMEEETR